MKLSDQPYILSQSLSAQAHSQGVNAPKVSGKPLEITGDSKVEHALTNEREQSSEYPMASDQEMHVRDKRKAVNFFKAKPLNPTPKPPVKPAPKPPVKPTPKPPVTPMQKPSKPAGGPNGAGDAVNSSKTITNLHNNNAFPPISSQLAASVRSSFLYQGVSTLISLPLGVGEHIASKAITDRLDAQAKMPGAEKKNADGTISTNDPSATQKQKLEARLENAEIKTEVLVNTILSVNTGPDARAVGKDPNAATDTDSRLGALECRMSATENQMKEIATRYGLIYEPYVAPESSETPTAASRMEVIEKRYAHMNKMVKRLIKNAEADAEDAE